MNMWASQWFLGCSYFFEDFFDPRILINIILIKKKRCNIYCDGEKGWYLAELYSTFSLKLTSGDSEKVAC